MHLKRFMKTQRRLQRRDLLRAALLAGIVAAASVALLGLSGWFITAAALAGAAGPTVAHSFNYMLPSATIRLLAILRTGSRYGEAMFGHAAALRAMAKLRPALFAAIAASPIRHALGYGSGETTARTVNDVAVLEQDIVRRAAWTGAACAVLAGGGLLALAGWKPLVAVLLCLGLLLLGSWQIGRRLQAPGRAVQRATGDLKTLMTGLVEAGPELRCYGLEDWARSAVEEAGRALEAERLTRARLLGQMALLQAAILTTASLAAFALSIQAGAPLAALAALAAAATVDGLAPLLRRLAEAGAVAEAEARLEAVLAAAEAAAPSIAPAAAPALQLFGLTAQPLQAGARLAITGRSGSGKSTLVECLLGLRPAPTGLAALDGTDIAHLPAGILRRSFAWLPQDAMLLAGTVRENLALADPAADDARMLAALHDAALPFALDSWIGDNGTALSGGERRRLCLARACLSPAPWLLLDEPTEALDAATEALVVARLAARLERTGQGLILVSHRPAPLALCPTRIDLEAMPATA